jgi:nucleolar protein 14
MTAEDKMMLRFQEERKKRLKSDRKDFNLEDGSDALTHMGQEIGDDYEHSGSDGESGDENGELDSRTVNMLNFGGGEDGLADGDPDKHKTKKEVMAELIAKSKYYKNVRQKNKEDQEVTRTKLDEEFKDLQGLLNFRPTKDDPNAERERLDDYDQTTNRLAMEFRAQATDRLLTDEEVAHTEKSRLDEAEKRRLRRMQGLPEEEEGEEKSSGRRRTDDDLEDNFLKEGSEEEGSDEEEDGDDAGDDSDDGDGSDSGDENDEDNDESTGAGGKAQVASYASGEKHEMPFVFECPTSTAEFSQLLQKHASGLADESLIIERICKYHAVKLNRKTNTRKMEGFLNVLVNRIMQVAGNSSHESRAETLDMVSSHCFRLAQDVPAAAGSLFCGILKKSQAKLRKAVESDENASCWPSAGDMALLRAVANIFPTTDLRHEVISPAYLLLGQCLSCNRVRGPAESPRQIEDIVASILSATMMLQYAHESNRIIPEVIAFAQSMIARCCPVSQVASQAHSEFRWIFPALTKCKGDEVPSLRWSWLLGSEECAAPEVAAAILGACLNLIIRAVECNSTDQTPAFPEMFSGILHTCTQLSGISGKKAGKLPAPLAVLCLSAVSKLTVATKKAATERDFLDLQVCS